MYFVAKTATYDYDRKLMHIAKLSNYFNPLTTRRGVDATPLKFFAIASERLRRIVMRFGTVYAATVAHSIKEKLPGSGQVTEL